MESPSANLTSRRIIRHNTTQRRRHNPLSPSSGCKKVTQER